MSDATKAVFLSYASQDAEAAKRICDALRAAGVEVWFDQSELRGGDQWDTKIRTQIKECALFMPVISANTQARAEGYFRLEWRLADHRTHLMGKSKAFVVPVCVDDTRDAQADVPDSFVAVQWTRLPAGETPPAFAERVQKLLGGDVGWDRPIPPAANEAGSGDPALQKKTKPSRPWLMAAGLLLVFIIAAVGLKQPWRSELPRAATPPAASSPGATELARVRARLTPDRWQREDFAAMAPTLDRLLEANPELADAWAMRSIINSLQVLRNYDSSTKPLEAGKAAADRAARLAPGSPLADIATGMHLVAMTSRGGDARVCRPYLDRGVAALPPDALTRYAQLASYWFAYDFDRVQSCGEAWWAAEPQASFPPWIFAQLNVVRRRPAEADKWAEIASADPNITGVRAYFTAFESRYYLCADLPGARAVLQKVLAAGRSVHRIVHGRWLVAMADRRWDEALQELAQVPETFLFDRSYHGPKALLAGLAHQRAGRLDAAAAQFREAERLLREHLAADSDNEELHLVLAVALACAGRGAEARNELALVEPLVKGRQPSIYRGSLVITIAQAYAVLGDYSQLAPWLRKLFVEPSQFPFTPASLRLDPRFAAAVEASEIQALLKEFASLDQPTAVAPKTDEKSVAVLAFANLSDDKANEYFSEGISEELLNVLAKIPDLKVTARTSSFHFKGKDTPIPEIAKQLGVAYVVEGSVRKAGNQVRITAQLIKAEDGFHVWSDTFTRDLKDIFAVQDEIAGLIAKNLSLKMGMTVRTEHQVNPEALAALLEGRHYWVLRTTEGFARAEASFNRAVALDPQWAPARAALANLLTIQASYQRGGGESASELFAAAAKEARRAIELDATLGEPVSALGKIAMESRRLAEAEEYFRRALALEPNNALIHDWYGDLAVNQGRLDVALAEYRRALELDPLSPYIQWDLAWELMHVRRYAEALPLLEQAEALTPGGSPRLTLRRARVLLELGRKADAEALLRAYLAGSRTETDLQFANEAVWCLRALGSTADAERWAADVLRQYPGTYASGVILLQQGQLEKAYALLEKTPPIFMQQIYWEPMFDPYRSTPGFQQLLAKLGCVAEYKVARATQARLLKEAEAKK